MAGAIDSRQPKIEILPWNDKYTDDFVRINRLWIEELFEVEKHDIEQMEKIGELVDSGTAFVVMARDRSSGEIVGTGALMYEFDSSGAVDKVEFAKFSVLPSARGLGAGTAIMVALLREAHRREALRVWVECNWLCQAAVALYEKFGFRHVELNPDTEYSRCNVKMELPAWPKQLGELPAHPPSQLAPELADALTDEEVRRRRETLGPKAG